MTIMSTTNGFAPYPKISGDKDIALTPGPEDKKMKCATCGMSKDANPAHKPDYEGNTKHEFVASTKSVDEVDVGALKGGPGSGPRPGEGHGGGTAGAEENRSAAQGAKDIEEHRQAQAYHQAQAEGMLKAATTASSAEGKNNLTQGHGKHLEAAAAHQAARHALEAAQSSSERARMMSNMTPHFTGSTKSVDYEEFYAEG